MDGEGRTSLKTYLKVLVNLGIILLLLLFCIFVLPRIVIYFMPFVIGWIIALIASPLVRFLKKAEDQTESGICLCDHCGDRPCDPCRLFCGI